MATWLELAGHDQLQHLIASTAWDDSAAWTVLGRRRTVWWAGRTPSW